jgi:hypothetical protein
MNRYVLCAALLLAASPLHAETSSAVRVARTAVAADQAVAAPRVERAQRQERPAPTDREIAAEHLNHIYQRAQNAVENGASPERVRAAVQDYKQQLRNRWNATHGN